MKKIIVFLAVAVMPFSGVFAAGAFDGINLQLGIGGSMTKSQTDQSAYLEYLGTYDQSFSFNKTNLVGSVSLGYSYGFSNELNLAANIFYNASSNNAGSNTQVFSDGTSMTRSMTLKNVMGISLEPGYYFSKNFLGFLKLGVAQASSSQSYSFSPPPEDGSSLDPENFGKATGYLLGLGAKYSLTESVYVGAEFYQINFAKKTNNYNYQTVDTFTISNQPIYNYGGITLGYRF